MDPYRDHHRKIRSPLDLEQPEAEEEQATNKPDVEKTADEINEEQHDDNQAVKGEKIPLMDHLTDLRRELIRSAIAFTLVFLFVFGTIHFWFPYITRGHELIILGPLEVIRFYMWISFALAMGLAMPFICFFIWQFVKPGLKEKESRLVGLYLPAMLLLFLLGLLFGYFIVNPASYQFLLGLGAIHFTVLVSAKEYMSFLFMTTLPLGLMFELPIVVLFLSALGVLRKETMRRFRKWAYLILGIVSALITPPDFISQLLVLIPMAILYESSLLLIGWMENRTTLPDGDIETQS